MMKLILDFASPIKKVLTVRNAKNPNLNPKDIFYIHNKK